MEIDIEQIIKTFGGAPVITAAIISFGASWWVEWRNKKWKEQTDTDLEVLKDKLSEKSSILTNLIEVQKSSHNFSQERRVKSVEAIWKELQKLKSTVSPTISFLYNAVLEDEIEALNKSGEDKSNDFFKDQLKGVDYDKFFKVATEFNKILASERPFLGYDLWLALEIFTKYLGRLMYRTQIDIKTNNIKHWNKDDAMLYMLQSYLTDEEYRYVMKQKLHSYTIIIDLFENKILNKIDEELSGTIASKNSLDHIKMIKRMLDGIDNKAAP